MRHWVFRMGGKDVQTMSGDDVVAFPVTQFAECFRTGAMFEAWDWQAGQWTVADIVALRADALARIDAQRFALNAPATAATPLDEEYEAKLREAERLTGPRPYLDREAALRGEPVEQTCDRVIARARMVEEARAGLRSHVSAIAVVAKGAVRTAATAAEIEQLTAQAIADMTGASQ